MKMNESWLDIFVEGYVQRNKKNQTVVNYHQKSGLPFMKAEVTENMSVRVRGGFWLQFILDILQSLETSHRFTLSVVCLKDHFWCDRTQQLILRISLRVI